MKSTISYDNGPCVTYGNHVYQFYTTIQGWWKVDVYKNVYKDGHVVYLNTK